MVEKQSLFKDILMTMRPKQWTKNLLIFAAPIFSGKLFYKEILLKTLFGFLLLCLISGTVYIFNDIADRERDRLHPKKKNRPIASGRITPVFAGVFAGVVLAFSFSGAYFINSWFLLVSFAYFTLQLLYTFYLKNIVLIDVFTIAGGFLLRALSGSAIAVVSMSPWLFICAVLLALFLGFGKRRHELLTLENSENHRKVLAEYSKELLDSLIVIVSSATIVCYSLYTFFSSTSEKHPGLLWTIPFVVYGIFRYLYLIYSRALGGNPEEILLSDYPLLIDIALWLLVVGISLYLY